MDVDESPRGLFRVECQPRGSSPHGAILLARPGSFTLLTALAAGIVATVLGFFLGVSTHATARLPGVVTPTAGVLRLVADRAGRVVESRVSEGQGVQAGEGLFVIRSERSDAQGRAVGDQVSRLIAQRRESLLAEVRHRRAQAAQQLTSGRQRLNALDDEVLRMENDLRLYERRVEIEQTALDRQHALQSHGMATASAVQEREAALLDTRQRLSQHERSIAGARREQSAAARELAEVEFQLRREDESSSRALAAIDQEAAEHEAGRETLVRAPRAGVVSALRAGAGQAVTAGEVLGHLWPEGALLQAELHAPARAAAFLSPGMPVRLHLDAFPHQRFGAVEGHVREIDLIASDASSAGQPPVYRVRVRLERQALAAGGIDHPLRPGMTLEAIVPLERRKLYEWVVDPLKQLAGASTMSVFAE